MAALEPLCRLLGINPEQLSREELIVIEAELFVRIINEMEKIMSEANVMKCVVNDLLATEEYSLSGIAFHTQIPEEVIFDVAAGHNESPSVTFWHRIIGLHKTVRPKLYHEIVKKIVSEYLPAA